MYFKCARGVFPATQMSEIGKILLSKRALPSKVRLRDLVISKNTESKNIGIYLLTQFWQSIIPELFLEQTGHNPLLLLQICTIRHQESESTSNYSPWHLDANFYGFDTPLWTVWSPFVESGIDAAGLEFCLADRKMCTIDDSTVRDFWSRVPRNERNQVAIDADDFIDFFQSRHFNIFSNLLYPGDAYIFDQYILHRTREALKPGKSRVAIEFRITSSERFPADVPYEQYADYLVSKRRADGNIDVVEMHEHFMKE